MLMRTSAEAIASAAETLRPHCQAPTACAAKTPGKHCVRCAARTPEVRQRKSEGIQVALLDPDKLARKQAAARRVSADPDIVARRTATGLVKLQDPQVKERHRAGCAAAMRRRLANPEEAERLRECGRKHGAKNLAAAIRPDALAKRAVSQRAARMAWCPEQYWPLNEQLKRKGYRLAERKEIILAEVPGTPEHARRQVANAATAMQLRHERDLASRY